MKQGYSPELIKAALDRLRASDDPALGSELNERAVGCSSESSIGSPAEFARHIDAMLTQNMTADLEVACQRPDDPWTAVADCLLTHLLAEDRITFLRYALKHDFPLASPRTQITQTLLPLAKQHLDHFPVPDVTPRVMVEWFFGLCLSDTELRRLTGNLEAPSAQMTASRAASVDAALKRIVHPSSGKDLLATIAV